MKSKTPLVISLGGSVITKDDYKHVPSIAQNIWRLSSKYQIYIVTGGGKIGRKLIEVASHQLKFKDIENRSTPNNIKHILDEVGIASTRLHAHLFAALYRYKKYVVPTTTKDAVKYAKHYRVVVMGGTLPNRSTDAVAMQLAKEVGAQLMLNISDVEGIYDKDPKKHKNAKLLSNLSYEEFWEIIKHYAQTPGNYALFDHLAFNIAKKHNIKIKFISYQKIRQFTTSGTLVG